MPASRPKIDTRALAYVGAQLEISMLAAQINRYIREFPLLRDHAVSSIIDTPTRARASKAPATGTPARTMTAAGRKALSLATKRRWRAVKKAGGNALGAKGAKG
jgi:hypothetical protein